MNDFIQLLTPISIIAGIVFGYSQLRRNQKHDDDSQHRENDKMAREMGTILSEIGYVKSQMDTIARKLENNDARSNQLSERLVAVEQSAKSAHSRIDVIVKKD